MKNHKKIAIIAITSCLAVAGGIVFWIRRACKEIDNMTF